MIAIINEGRTVGAELECYGPLDRQQLEAVLVRNGVRVYNSSSRHCNAGTAYVVTIKGDGSIRPGTEWAYTSYELTFMMYPTAQGQAWLKKLCDLLNKVGVTVNDSCGMHVHVDASDGTPDLFKSLFNLVFKYENVLGGFLPVSRRTNSFCKMRGERDRRMLDRCRTMQDVCNVTMDRYHGLNMYAYSSHRTVEFRYHSGTVDFVKIWSWALLCLRMYEHAKARSCTSKGKLPATPENLRNMLCAIGLKPNNRIYTTIDERYGPVRDYLVKRYWHFARQTTEYIARRRASRTTTRPATPAPAAAAGIGA